MCDRILMFLFCFVLYSSTPLIVTPPRALTCPPATPRCCRRPVAPRRCRRPSVAGRPVSHGPAGALGSNPPHGRDRVSRATARVAPVRCAPGVAEQPRPEYRGAVQRVPAIMAAKTPAEQKCIRGPLRVVATPACRRVSRAACAPRYDLTAVGGKNPELRCVHYVAPASPARLPPATPSAMQPLGLPCETSLLLWGGRRPLVGPSRQHGA